MFVRPTGTASVNQTAPSQRTPWEQIKNLKAPFPETDKRRFGFWFNYFWTEACSVAEVTNVAVGAAGEQLATDTKRELAVLFARVLSLPGPTPNPEVQNGWTDEQKRFVLTRLLKIGFVAKSQATLQDGATLFVDQIQMSATENIKIGYRCDTRPWSMISAAGYQRRVDDTDAVRDWALDQQWHPFSQRDIKQSLWFRRGSSKDNCLHTVVSVGTTFRDVARFPRIDDGPLFGLPRKSISSYTAQEKSDAIMRGRANYTTLTFVDAAGGRPAHIQSTTAIYVIKVEGLRGYDTEAEQRSLGVSNAYPERGVTQVPPENFLARVAITRKHLDNDGEFDVEEIVYGTPKFEFLPDEESVRGKLGGADDALHNFRSFLERVLVTRPYDAERRPAQPVYQAPVRRKLVNPLEKK